MRVRGLKPHTVQYHEGCKHVAPHAGAWIETDLTERYINLFTSHPMRVRGLKQRWANGRRYT